MNKKNIQKNNDPKNQEIEQELEKEMYKKLVHLVNEDENFGKKNYRYSCECDLINSKFGKYNIKVNLKAIGDSIIILEKDKISHIHVHTNKPTALFEMLSRYGDIKNPRVEDIHLQIRLINQNGRTALITDSMADLPQRLIDKYDIHVIPVNIEVDNKHFLDKISITPEFLLTQLKEAKEYPKRKVPSDRQIIEKLEFLTKHYSQIIMVASSSQQSSIYSSFEKIAHQYRTEKINIRVIDSKLYSASQGLLVLEIAKMIDNSFHDYEIEENVARIIMNSKIYIASSTMEIIRKGNNVSKILRKFEKLLDLKPLLSLDPSGKENTIATSLKQEKLIDKILKQIQECKSKFEILDYVILYSDDLEKAQELELKLIEILEMPPQFFAELSCAGTLAIGQGAIGVGFILGDVIQESKEEQLDVMEDF